MSADRTSASEIGAFALLAASAFSWAGNHVVGRWMAFEAQPVPPGGLSTLRWALAFVVLLPFAWRQIEADWPQLKERAGMMIFLGLMGGAGFSVMQYYALHYTLAINAGVMNSVGPAFIILAGALFFRDRVIPAQIGGIALSLVGVLIMITRGELWRLLTLELNFGDVLLLLNMLIFAVYSAFLRLGPRVHLMTFISALNFLACVGSIPAMAIETAMGHHVPLTWATVVSVVYTGLFTSLVGYLAWSAGIARLGIQRAGAFLHLVPLFGALLSVLLLGEPPRLFHAAGLVLIIAGVTIAARRRQ